MVKYRIHAITEFDLNYWRNLHSDINLNSTLSVIQFLFQKLKFYCFRPFGFNYLDSSDLWKYGHSLHQSNRESYVNLRNNNSDAQYSRVLGRNSLNKQQFHIYFINQKSNCLPSQYQTL